MAEDTPELPLPDRGATLVMRVMPDDNSCLFRAFAAAVLPGDDLSMLELRSLVASQIQEEPDVYTKVVLDNREPDDYCRWIQTEEAWGGAIELAILSKHFNVEVCSIDVQSLRIDRFNEGAPIRCILVYSGIHYDTIVQSPSDPPHIVADNPPELDKRVWDSYDDDILVKAQQLCEVLQGKHYFTNVREMAIRCTNCGWVGYGEAQAAVHAQQTGHYDMAEQKS
ncbi:ubiquitin-specific protease otu1 [Pseudogymnoascus australis]